jgi:hypothetical protein
MGEIRPEEFLYVPHVQDTAALIAWGAFYLKQSDEQDADGTRRYKLLDDDAIKGKYGRGEWGSIGRKAQSYGFTRVRIGVVTDTAEPFDAYYGGDPDAGVDWRNWVEVPFGTYYWFAGLRPQTRYRYQVEVDGKRWGEATSTIFPDPENGRAGWLRPEPRRRRHEFHTFPREDGASGRFSFGVLGDPGTGKPVQAEVGRALAGRVHLDAIRFVLTTGDNIYARGGKIGKIVRGIFGRAASSGDEDDDWFTSYFLPYRDVISRVPVFPCIGNHDSDNTEDDDDLSEMVDNFHLEERFEEWASLWGAGDTATDAIFYRFRYGRDVEFVAVDTSFSDKAEASWLEKAFNALKGNRKPPILHENHQYFLERIEDDPHRPTWRIPYGHHPQYTLGPVHENSVLMQAIARRLKQAGAYVWLGGHEHNLQHHEVDGMVFLVTGAAGKSNALEKLAPGASWPAYARAYTAEEHALVIDVDGLTLRVRAFNREGEQIRPKRLRPANVTLPDGRRVELEVEP